VGVGYNALTLSAGGEGNNTAAGYAALSKATTGSYNVGVGANALANLTTGAGNVGVGLEAGTGVTTQSNNTYIGQQAGKESQGSANVLIGFQAGKGAGAMNGELYIANNSTTPWIRGAESGSKIGFCGKAPIFPTADVHTETTAALWGHLHNLGLA
jgi:hypothetical protein